MPRRKPKADNTETWNEIEELVQRFKDGDRSVGEQLLQKFENYFNKFYLIVKNITINLNDRETKFFISMFLNDATLFQKKEDISSDDYHTVMQAFGSVCNTYGKLPREDIYQDMYLVFFTLLNRYKPIGKTFGSYLCTSFVYEYSRLIKSYLKDPLSRVDKTVEYIDMFHRNRYVEPEYAFFNMPYDEEKQDDLWIHGLTCSEAFSKLTPLERIILIRYYIERKSDREIAEQIGRTRNYVNIKRLNAVKKISEYMGIELE